MVFDHGSMRYFDDLHVNVRNATEIEWMGKKRVGGVNTQF